MSYPNAEPRRAEEAPQNLLMIQLVINGAIAALDREAIRTALYWLKFEIEDSLIPAQK